MSATVSMRLRHLLVQQFFQPDIAPAPPANLYVCLTYDVLAANAPGLMLNEPLLGSYARRVYPLDSAHWAASGFGEVLNIDAVTFPAATLDWGLMAGWALSDTSGVGTGLVYASGSLVTPTYVEAGRTIVVAPRGIALGLYD